MKRLILAAALLMACDDPFVADPVRAYKAVTTGGEHSCALSDAGEAYCWGRGLDGELGTGAKEIRTTPARVAGSLVFSQISAGANHTCALATSGDAYCWGWNAYFQRGNFLDARDAEPVKVSTNERFTSITSGAHHSCAISVDSLAFCWGYNRHGQLGNGTNNTGAQAIQISGGIRFTQISAGAWHTCALTRVGSAYCWGSNELGQLGIGTNQISATTPTLVSTSVTFRQIDGGETHTCGVATNGGFWCWGSDEHGQLGTGGSFREGLPGASTPVAVSAQFPSGTAIYAGSQHTCAIGSTGAGRCWGRGEYGQLAVGSTHDSYHPQPINLMAQSISFTAFAPDGYTHTCGLIDRSVYCWGTGRAGQLGVEQSRFASLPQRVHD